MHDDGDNEAVRLDKWLWAARFFKTRALAAEAIGGGKIDIDGAHAKPSRIVRLDDKLNIRRGPFEWTIIDVGADPCVCPPERATTGGRPYIGFRNRTIKTRSARDRQVHQARLVACSALAAC